MKQPLRAGLIGTGGYGAEHLRRLTLLEDAGDITLAAVADPTLDDQGSLASKLAARGVKCYPSDSAMLSEDLDLVVIASPIPLHEEMALRWLGHGAHILLEKPPVPTIQQLRSLIAADVESRIRIGFQLIHLPGLRLAKDWVREGRIGDLRRVAVGACWPRADAYYARSSWAGALMHGDRPAFDGPATNALSHVIHNLSFLAGAGAEEFARPATVQGEFYRVRPIPSYDLASIRGEFEGSVAYDITLAHCVGENFGSRIEATGTEGSIMIDSTHTECRGPDGQVVERINSGWEQCFEAMYQRFLGGTREPSSGGPSTLADCEPYSVITCGGLLSSGVIRELPKDHYERRDPDGQYIVHGLDAAVRRSLETGESFHSQGVPWAWESESLRAADVTHLQLDAFAATSFKDASLT